MHETLALVRNAAQLGDSARAGLGGRSVCLALVALASFFVGPALRAQPTDSVDLCLARVEESPDDLGSYRCFREITRRSGHYVEAVAALETLLEASPSDPRPLLFLGLILRDRGDPAALQLLSRAASEFASRSQPEGEVHARLALSFWFSSRDRIQEAISEIERAREAATGEEDLLARVDFSSAWLATKQGDYTLAEELFERTESLVFPDGPPDLRQGSLNGLGYVAWATGRYLAAATYYRREAEQAARNGDAYAEAGARFNQALMAERLATRPEDSPDAAVYEAAVDAAVRAENRALEARARLLLAQEVRGEKSRAQLRLALEIGREVQLPDVHLMSLRLLGVRNAEELENPEPGLQQIRESVQLAGELGDRDAELRGKLSLANTLWNVGYEEQAIAAWNAALDDIEGLRRRQEADEESARVASRFAFAYYQLAGRFLERAVAGGDADAIESALKTIERLRFDSFQERIEASSVSHFPGIPPDSETLSLVDLQAALEPDEALLSYQLSGGQEKWGKWLGGSWLVVLTRHDSRVYPLADASHLTSQVELFLGSLRDSGIPADRPLAGSEALSEQVFGSALEELPDMIAKLSLIPDGVLHTLPFAVLDPAGPDRFLVERFALGTLPSISAWYRLRHSPVKLMPAAVIGIADPAIENRSAAEWGEGLAELPSARREARRVCRLIGGSSKTLMGERATESSLKRLRSGVYSVLHLATHAVVDPDEPERTAILLAADEGGEDGRLTIPEIVDLDLGDSLVVLASCRSASGVVLPGTGVLGPTRAFLMAGARAVVGTLWPVEDREIESLLEIFYERLAEQESVAQALADAQRERIAEGAPPASWAGVVAIGDASFHLGPVEPKHRLSWVLGGASFFLLGCLAYWIRVSKVRDRS